jgi:thioester reductase-like protein
MTATLRDALHGRHILLTGATGFLGQVWLSMVLSSLPGVRVTALIRKGRHSSATARMERELDTSPCFRPLREQHGRGLGAWAAERLTVLEADVEKPRFGLEVDALRALRRDRPDAVVHMAGLTDFEPEPSRAVAVNVVGAKHAADIASFLGCPLLHTSTCFAAGVADGEVGETLEPGVSPNGTRFSVAEEIAALREALEGADDAQRIPIGLERASALGWPNLYCYSKGLAEHLLANRADVKVSIVRPAIVECARTFPFPGWNFGLNTAGPLAWLISTGFRQFPAAPGHIMDVVPVDDVARGTTLVLAALLKGEHPQVVQLASGDVNPLHFDRAIELTGLGYRRWARTHGSGLDQVFCRLDSVATKPDSPWSFSKLKGLAVSATALLSKVEPAEQLPEPLRDALLPSAQSWLDSARSQANKATRQLQRLDEMLTLYRPFIHDLSYTFRTDTVRKLSERYGEPGWTWDIAKINWRSYWVDVQYPGLATYTFPIFRGERPPTDAPSVPPLRLASAPAARQLASK